MLFMARDVVGLIGKVGNPVKIGRKGKPRKAEKGGFGVDGGSPPF